MVAIRFRDTETMILKSQFIQEAGGGIHQITQTPQKTSGDATVITKYERLYC